MPHADQPERPGQSPARSDAAGSPARSDAAESFADVATRTLRDRIVLLDLPPGSPLDDEALGRGLGVGRTPMREAIKRLEAERLVTVFPRRGTFVAQVDLAELAAISEIRAELEPLAARRAAQFSGAGLRERMEQLVGELQELDPARTPVRTLLRHDLDVHRAIYDASGNGHLAEAARRYGNLATRMWGALADRLDDVGGHTVEHVDLLTLVLNGDTAGAADMARHHVTSFDQMVRNAV